METVRDRLEAIPALAGRIQGAAKLAQLTQAGAAVQANTAAFVLPLGLRGGKADAVSGMFRQSIDRLVGVVLMVRNLGDATGEKAFAELDPMIEAVIEALAGWAPDEAIGVYVLARGELVSISAGTITYQLDFALDDQLRIAR
ncbi:hypothetical protein [Sphingomonas sp. CROZ-RG-20F-R02-07]|uniref:phage tail terminator protein n=1 Tax=Sphingomonas sp. CROZ-RG-20F-R02-07 TaxID=2914832 RepID=UPI001F55F9FF|nr:hypothetical protein [Sphingomonas sp. CROZ-RG-20F-R02-07]